MNLKTISLLFALLSIWNIAHTEEDLLIENADTLNTIITPNKDTTSAKKSFIYRALNQTKPVKYLAFPLVYYTPETKLMLGAGAIASWKMKNDSANTASFISPWFTYSTNRQVRGQIFGSLYFNGQKHQLDFETEFQKLKRPFFGIGNKLDKDFEEIALTRSYSLNVSYFNRIKKVFLIGGIYDLDDTYQIDAEPGKILDTTDIEGKHGGFVQGLGLQAAFDNRDDIYFPYKGNFFQVNAVGYPTFLGSKYQFATVKAEYRSFINIKRKVVLASQILAKMSFGDVPFYKMPTLGGDEILRGYTNGRGRDKFLFNLQGELRVPLNRFIISGFFGSGIVGDKFMDYFKVKDYSYSIGAGARFKPFKESGVVLRMDVGFWQGTYGIYFVFNEAF